MIDSEEMLERLNKAIVPFEVNTLDCGWAQYQMNMPQMDTITLAVNELSVSLGRLLIKQIDNAPPRYSISVDGEEIKRVRKLSLEMNPGELPVCKLEVFT